MSAHSQGTDSGVAEGGGALVADHPAREADQDRRQGRATWPLHHIPACRGGNSAAAVCGNPATDRRPAAEASTDMTPCIIAAVGLNRRAPGSRHLPNGCLLAPDCTLTWSRMHRVAHPKPPNRDKRPRFRPKLDCATVLGGWEESFGKSRIR